MAGRVGSYVELDEVERSEARPESHANDGPDASASARHSLPQAPPRPPFVRPVLVTPHASAPDAVLGVIGSHEAGLTWDERAARASTASTIEDEPPEPLWHRFIDQIKEPLVLLLFASACVAALVGQYDDAAFIIIAVLFVSVFAVLQESRADATLRALKQLDEPECNILVATPALDGARTGAAVRVDSATLVLGDVVLLCEGVRVPADLRLVKSTHLHVNEATLTGESEPVEKNAFAACAADAAVHARPTMVHHGTIVDSGEGLGVVVALGSATVFGSIAGAIRGVERTATPLQESMSRLGKHLSIAALLIIGATFCVGVFAFGRPWLEMLLTSVSLAVAAIPEGLPVVVTITLALGVMRMGKHHAIVRHM